MADISKIKLPNGSEYNIKDTNAVKKSGDTMTGALNMPSNKYYDQNNEYGIDMNNSDIIGINGIFTDDVAEDGREGLNFYRDATHFDSFHINNGIPYVTPNRPKGSAGEKFEVPLIRSCQTGTTDPTIRPLISKARANRLSFLPADQIIIEKTTDGGTTWVDAECSNWYKKTLFSTGNAINIPLLNGERSTQCGLRITITGMKYNVPDGTPETNKYNYWNSTYVKSQERYFNVREWWFWLSSASDTITCTIQAATGANPDNWITYFNNSNFKMTGWSGSDWIRAGNGNTFGGSTTQTGNYWNWRLTFWSSYKANASEFTGTSSQSISVIRCYGDSVWSMPNNLGFDDHLYTYNADMEASFPSSVTATNFIGKINGDVIYSNNSTSKDANTINENGIGYYTSNGPSTSLGASANDGALYSQRYSSSWQGQIAQDYRNGGLFVRGKKNGTWQPWQKVYDSAHKPSLTDDITGTLPIANGGTGKTNGKDAANYFMNALDTGSSTPVDADYYISQYVGGGTTTTTYHRRPVSALWEYIKGKISSILGLTATNYGGTSAKATADASGNTITSYYAPKSTAVTNVALATNKITKTINGSTTDVVGAATTSAYGITKLNTATNSTSTTEAATPSAVKIAKDRADEAYTKAATVESGLNGTLIYDHSYTISNGVATFTPHVYLKGEEVTSNYAKSCFVWKYKLANDVTGTPSYIPLTTNNDRTCTVTISVLGYGGYVLGEFTPA